MERQSGKQLLEKFRLGNISTEEVRLLENWYADYLQHAEPFDDVQAYLKDMEILDRSFPFENRGRRYQLWPKIAGVAVAVALMVLGIYFFGEKTDKQKDRFALAGEIRPGSNKAVIRLGNRNDIILKDTEKGVVLDGNNISYEDGSRIGLAGEVAGNMIAIETPKGGQYQARLSDGTRVWLNAASSIEFPSEFSGNSRTVRITGEVYFEVAKDTSRPFIVNSAGQRVEVLGTHFNISSYTDEPAIQTTLLEGSVKITPLLAEKAGFRPAGKSILLRPGEQARNTNGSIRSRQINVNQAIAWKNGKFMFDDEPLSAIMRKISRWYNVEIEYQGIDPDREFGGSISKFEQVSKVLEKLEMTGSVHFKVIGNKIIVTK